MAKILELLKFLPGLIAAVMALVKSFEVPGNGEEKKSAVMIVIGLMVDTLSTIITLPLEKEKVLDFVGKAIDAVVAFLNAINLFKKDTVNPT